MIQKYRKRRLLYLTAMLWELFRTGNLWSINQQVLLDTFGVLGMFYILWLASPLLLMFSGYFLVILEPQAKRLCVLLTMGRGFQALTGVIAIIFLVTLFKPAPMVSHSILILLILIGDWVFLLLQLLNLRRTIHQGENFHA
jgi:hypothetical protein